MSDFGEQGYPEGFDSAVPDPPVLSGSAGNAQVILLWTASTSATSYTVYRRLSGGGSYTIIATPTLLTYTDSPLTNGQAYDYYVTATNSTGESMPSNVLTLTPSAGGGSSANTNIINLLGFLPTSAGGVIS